MSSICESENVDVLRLLASNRKIVELILELGVGTSSLAKLMSQGFHMKDIQQALEIDSLDIENDYWLKNCDITFANIPWEYQHHEEQYITASST